MALPSFFRTYKNKQFNYIPIFYNKLREELQDRIRNIEQDMGVNNTGAYRPTITRGSIRRKHTDRAKAEKRSAIRVLIIIIVLLGLVYYLLSR